MSKHAEASTRLCDAAQTIIDTIRDAKNIKEIQDCAELQELKDALDKYENAWES